MHHRQYIEFLRHARRVTRRADEAEDLLQSVLLSAVEAGRSDLTLAENRRWLVGALRKRALFDARSAIRRRRREAAVVPNEPGSGGDSEPPPVRFVATLPPRLRTTALLALTGHTRQEIAWLLSLSDATLRQRFTQLRRRWRNFGGGDLTELPGLDGSLAFGRIRQALIKPVRGHDAILASHDPDGHLFIVNSQNGRSRQLSHVDK
ncbi:MAG: transcriptional regulator [Alphaproteobacteria bacterium]|nr:transcriptional regulator [Alphaproteobacteria bacterium]